MSRSISDPRELERAWGQQYARLAGRFSRILPKPGGVLVEIGCGRGQLTIPLGERIQAYWIIAVDRFKGPYSKEHGKLLSSLSAGGKRVGIRIIVSDYKTWLENQPDSKYDAVISSEFLPEIDSEKMRGLFGECHRVLRPGGLTVHSFLSAKPRNARQKRLIEADSDSRWTKTPPEEWFSPTTKLVVDYLKSAGFVKPRLINLKSGLVIRSEAAKHLLADWDVRPSYWRTHKAALSESGLEIPDWIIVRADKTAST